MNIFFISLNIYGRHHSKLFRSPSDRTSHSACSEVVPGCLVRQFWELVAWRFRNSSSWWWRLLMKVPPWVLSAFWQLLVTHGHPMFQLHVPVFDFYFSSQSPRSRYTCLAGQGIVWVFLTTAFPYWFGTNHPPLNGIFSSSPFKPCISMTPFSSYYKPKHHGLQ